MKGDEVDEYEDDYEQQEEPQPRGGGGQLRKQLEETLKENRELKREREAFQAQQLYGHVASSLEQAGFIGDQAKFVPVDVAQDPARLHGWIQENQNLLARNQPGEEPDEGASELGADRKDGIRKMQSLNAGGASASVDLDALHQRMLDPSLSEEDFDNLIAQYRT